MTDRFFRLLTVSFLSFEMLFSGFERLSNLTPFFSLQELSVGYYLLNSGTPQAAQQGQGRNFLAIDNYAKLVFAILKVCIHNSL